MRSFPFYLVRHGDAEPLGRDGDAARRLSPEGRARFEELARAIAGELQITRILTSPFARARETAGLLSERTGAPVQEEPALASGCCSGPELLALAERTGPGTALVGHNPEIADAVVLASPGPQRVKPGTVAAIETLAGRYRLAWIREP